MSDAELKTSELVSIEDLDQAIVNLAARINAATYELLVLIRQFEDRGGFVKWGLRDCAEWLAFRCDLSPSAAYEKVRVARALRTLPEISEAFRVGKLSYSKVRALTRVASKQDESALVKFALNTTAARVEERCREMRFGISSSVGVAERARANRNLRLRRDDERGMMTVTVEIPLEVGEMFEKALDKARNENDFEKSPLVEESWSTQQADAFASMVQAYMAGEGEPDAADNYLVTVHVDQSALAGYGGRAGLPLETVKRLCCDSKAVVITEDDHGEPLSIGRKTRIVPTAIKRAVSAKYRGQCAFPGCCNKRFLHYHHIEHWSNGGETSVDNLMPLCTRHHPLFHEGRFRIEKDFQDSWIFVRPDGLVIPPSGYVPEDLIDDSENSSAEEFSAAARHAVLELPPPAYIC